MSLLKSINEMAVLTTESVHSEMRRIASYWKEHGSDMSDNDLLDAIANDLEQLEYTPEQIDMLAPRVVEMIHD